jgi:hypothetical protein
MSRQKKSLRCGAFPACGAEDVDLHAVAQDGVVAPYLRRNGEGIEYCVVKIRYLLAADADNVMMRFNDRIEPHSFVQRCQAGNDAMPLKRLESGVDRCMGNGRVGPLDGAIQFVRAGVRSIPKQSLVNEQPLRRHLQPCSPAFLDKSLYLEFYSLPGHIIPLFSIANSIIAIMGAKGKGMMCEIPFSASE